MIKKFKKEYENKSNKTTKENSNRLVKNYSSMSNKNKKQARAYFNIINYDIRDNLIGIDKMR